MRTCAPGSPASALRPARSAAMVQPLQDLLDTGLGFIQSLLDFFCPTSADWMAVAMVSRSRATAARADANRRRYPGRASRGRPE